MILIKLRLPTYPRTVYFESIPNNEISFCVRPERSFWGLPEVEATSESQV